MDGFCSNSMFSSNSTWIIIGAIVLILVIYYASRKRTEKMAPLTDTNAIPSVRPVEYDYSEEITNQPEFIDYGPGTYTAAGRPGAEF